MIQTLPPPTDLPEVVVTAARLPPAATEAAFSVVRLDGEALESAGRLDEALKSVPAVSLFRRTDSRSANPTTQGLSLRAVAPSGAGRALVTLDGVPLNDPFGGWVIWAQTPPEAVDSLDVVRGAGSGPYGAGVLTGAVLLRERDEGAVLDVSAAERSGARAAASGAVSLGVVRLVGSAQVETTDGYVPVRGDAAGAADTPLDLDSRAASLRADLPLGTAALSLRAAGWEEERGSGLEGARARSTGHSLSATAAKAPPPTGWGWRLQAWRIESDLANSSVAVSLNRATTTPANDQFETPAVGWGVNAALRGRAGMADGRLEWELGADARTSEGETHERFRYMAGAFTRGREAGGRTAVAGAYLDASWSRDAWLIAGGVRADRWSNADGRRFEYDLASGAVTLDEADPDRDGEVVSGRLAARRDLGGGYALRAAAYSAFRPATLNELHRPFRVGNDLTEANAALTPERLEGIEVGLGFQGERFDWTLTAFGNRLDDAIVNVTIGEGPATFPRAGFVPAGGVLRQRRNAGTIEATGLEAAVEARGSPTLEARLALALTDARMDGGDQAPQLTGLRPAQAPERTLTAGLRWRPVGRLTLAADVRHESARFEDDLNSRVLEAATTLDLGADWSVTDATTLWVRLDNATDVEAEVSETATGVAGFGPPRTLSIGLRLRR